MNPTLPEDAELFRVPRIYYWLAWGLIIVFSCFSLLYILLPWLEPGENHTVLMIFGLTLFGGAVVFSAYLLRRSRAMLAVSDRGLWHCFGSDCNVLDWNEISDFHTRFWKGQLEFCDASGLTTIPVYREVQDFERLYNLIRTQATAIRAVQLPATFYPIRFGQGLLAGSCVVFLAMLILSATIGHLVFSIVFLGGLLFELGVLILEPTSVRVSRTDLVITYPFRSQKVSWDEVVAVSLPIEVTSKASPIMRSGPIQLELASGPSVKLANFRDGLRLGEILQETWAEQYSPQNTKTTAW